MWSIDPEKSEPQQRLQWSKCYAIISPMLTDHPYAGVEIRETYEVPVTSFGKSRLGLSLGAALVWLRLRRATSRNGYARLSKNVFMPDLGLAFSSQFVPAWARRMRNGGGRGSLLQLSLTLWGHQDIETQHLSGLSWELCLTSSQIKD